MLFNSAHNKIFTLPDETVIYPDPEGRFITTVAQEKSRNPRLGRGESKHRFIQIMDNLDLPYPRKIDFAVPGHMICGRCPDNILEELWVTGKYFDMWFCVFLKLIALPC